MKMHKKPMKVLSAVWSWLRQVSGDAAHDNYLRFYGRCGDLGAHRAPAPPLARAEFYLDSLRRRYSTVSRCC